MLTHLKKHIRVLLSFLRAKDLDVVSRGRFVVKGMTGNPAYPSPPVDLPTLNTVLDSYSTAISDALDGGKKAIAERSRQREVVLKMFRALAHYVEAACNDDMTTFLSSGFEPVAATRVAPQALPPLSIRRIDYGNTGQLLVSITAVARASSYELRCAALAPGGTPGPWTSLPFATVRTPTPCNGLTPGTAYVFQVRALGRLGLSDWSDSVTKMCA